MRFTALLEQTFWSNNNIEWALCFCLICIILTSNPDKWADKYPINIHFGTWKILPRKQGQEEPPKSQNKSHLRLSGQWVRVLLIRVIPRVRLTILMSSLLHLGVSRRKINLLTAPQPNGIYPIHAQHTTYSGAAVAIVPYGTINAWFYLNATILLPLANHAVLI